VEVNSFCREKIVTVLLTGCSGLIHIPPELRNGWSRPCWRCWKRLRRHSGAEHAVSKPNDRRSFENDVATLLCHRSSNCSRPELDFRSDCWVPGAHVVANDFL